MNNYIEHSWQDFLTFISERQVLNIFLGLVIANQLIVIVNTLTTGIINPILNRIFFGRHETFQQTKLNIFGIEIEIGKLITNLLNFFIILLILFFIWKSFKKMEHKKNQ
jgi:large conductance mechanosensitive channel